MMIGFANELVFEGIRQGSPNWGTCTPRGTFAHPKGYIGS